MDLVCPKCKSHLRPGELKLHCPGCNIEYPVVDGFPSLLINPGHHRDFYEKTHQSHTYSYVKRDHYFIRSNDHLPDQVGMIIRRKELLSALEKFYRARSEPLAVLDAGCNDGVMAQFVIRGCDEIVCSDLSMEALRQASTILRDRALPHPRSFTFAQANVTALPFSSNIFDIVLLTEVIEHVPDARLVLDEVHRILKPGGLAFITTPNRSGRGVLYGKIKAVTVKLGMSLIERREGYRQVEEEERRLSVKNHEQEYRVQEMASMLAAAHLTVKRHDTKYISYLDLQGFSKLVRGMDRYLASYPMVRLVAWLDKAASMLKRFRGKGFIQIWEVTKSSGEDGREGETA